MPPRFVPRLPLPRYAYRPGRLPHPHRAPDGHWNDPGVLRPTDAELFAYGVDLFHHGFYWEAHEAWEALWHLQQPHAPERALTQGLIQYAAALLKRWEGLPQAAGLFRAALEKIEPLLPAHERLQDVRVEDLARAIRDAAAGAPPAALPYRLGEP